VSSANNLIEALGTEFEISFTYNRNNKGPKTDPCGTPQDIFPKSEETSASKRHSFFKEKLNIPFHKLHFKNRKLQT